MRLAWFAVLVPVATMAVRCAPAGEEPPLCGCPCECSYVEPQFLCALAQSPTLALEGPCRVSGETDPSRSPVIPLFSGTDAGVCHATLTLPSGAVYSTEVTFTGVWLPCGSDPHGCGEEFDPPNEQWTIDNCADAASFADGETE
jgi:hypothetical protein